MTLLLARIWTNFSPKIFQLWRFLAVLFLNPVEQFIKRQMRKKKEKDQIRTNG
jgi:hypothetical protein